MTPLPEELLEQGECIDADPGMYFPAKGDNWMADRAKALCARCPVVDVCREWAIANLLDDAEDAGVWGGMSPNERQAERRRRGGTKPRSLPIHVQPHGTEAGYARHRRRGEEPCGACREGNAQAKARRTGVA